MHTKKNDGGKMSTRSYICLEKKDGSIEGIYCHCDGYLTHNGAMLIDHYKTKNAVEKLLELGSISYLGQNVAPDPSEPHSFSKPQDGVTVAYGRDRGEIDTESKTITLDDINKDPWIEYVYVFGKDGKWRYFSHGDYTKDGLKDLQTGLDKEFSEIGIKRPEGIYGYYPPQFVKKLKKMQEIELGDKGTSDDSQQ